MSRSSSASGGGLGGVVLGIDVGGTTTEAVAVDGGGGILARRACPTTRSDPDGLVRATIGLAEQCLLDAGLARVDGVGIGIPGIVDPLAGTVTHAVNLGLGREPLPVGPVIGRALGCGVAMENDVRAAALEALVLAARHHPGVRDVVFVNLGTGVAAGVIAGGRMVTGPLRTAGEIGHVPFGGSEPCACGLDGCLETILSGPAIARRWPGNGLPHAARDLFAAAERGEERAEATASAVVEDLVTLLQWLAVTTGTAALVLGGGVATSHPSILGRVRAAVAARTSRSTFAACTLDAARVHAVPPGHPIGALGAAALARLGPTVLPVGLLGRNQAVTQEKEHL